MRSILASACILFLGFASILGAREVRKTWDQRKTMERVMQDLSFYQAERLELTLTISQADITTNSAVVWKLVDPAITRRWWSITGTVESITSGKVVFAVSPPQSNVATGAYYGFVAAYSSTNEMTVLAAQDITVQPSPAADLFSAVNPITLERGSW